MHIAREATQPKPPFKASKSKDKLVLSLRTNGGLAAEFSYDHSLHTRLPLHLYTGLVHRLDQHSDPRAQSRSEDCRRYEGRSTST